MAAQHGEFGAGSGIPQSRCVVVGGGQHARFGPFKHRVPDHAVMAAQDG